MGKGEAASLSVEPLVLPLSAAGEGDGRARQHFPTGRSLTDPDMTAGRLRVQSGGPARQRTPRGPLPAPRAIFEPRTKAIYILSSASGMLIREGLRSPRAALGKCGESIGRRSVSQGKARIERNLRVVSRNGFTMRLNRQAPLDRFAVCVAPRDEAATALANIRSNWRETSSSNETDFRPWTVPGTGIPVCQRPTIDYAVAPPCKSRRSRRRSMGTSPMLRDATARS